jgi:putative nucleotidyltransferase with HDIG domain
MSILGPLSSAGPFARSAPGLLRLGRALRLDTHRFIGLVSLSGLASLAIPPQWGAPLAVVLPAFVALTVLSTALEFAAVQLPHEGTLSVATIPHIATILLLPPPWGAVSVSIAMGIEEGFNRRPLAKVVFNMASLALTLSLASLAVGMLGNPWATIGARDDIRAGLMIVVAAVAYQGTNKALISGIIAITTGRGFGYVVRANGRNTGLTEFGAGVLGALFAILWMIHPLWTALLTVPAAVMSRTLGYVRQLERETHSAVRTLARVVDHRDPSTAHHSERVAEYAVLLARELNLDDDLVEVVEQAASVHDLGKIGVPDRILLKPGALTEAERTAMWVHTEIGAEILGHYELFRAGSTIVLHHHERYDGTGYPGRLAGDQIPLGARVVAVADSFDAMTSDRPYRRALSIEDAVDRLRAGAGSQWDPSIVAAFLRLAAEGRLTSSIGENPQAAAADHATASRLGLDAPPIAPPASSAASVS